MRGKESAQIVTVASHSRIVIQEYFISWLTQVKVATKYVYPPIYTAQIQLTIGMGGFLAIVCPAPVGGLCSFGKILSK